MTRLNRVGQRTARFLSEGHDCRVFFFDGYKWVGSADCLLSARMVAPGTVAVSASGRQWVAVGGNKCSGARGWSFVSPYVDRHSVDAAEVAGFDNSSKSLKIRDKLDAYLDYFSSVKGHYPGSVALRREQFSVCGVTPGQLYKGVCLEAYV